MGLQDTNRFEQSGTYLYATETIKLYTKMASLCPKKAREASARCAASRPSELSVRRRVELDLEGATPVPRAPTRPRAPPPGRPAIRATRAGARVRVARDDVGCPESIMTVPRVVYRPIFKYICAEAGTSVD